MKSKRPEILAPAGSMDALKAAVAAGADAVYFGLERFNARERAPNFTVEDLPETMAFLHLRGVKGYVTFNTLIYESELSQAEEILRALAATGVDGVIVQDLGIAKMARALAPGLAIHASTQMTITDAASAEVAKSLGVTRAIVARELSTQDIAAIARATDLELEVFVHGALCVSYSGQCFTSASWGGRSANRGECAQACRLPYDLLVDDELRDLGPHKYLLSPLDLMGVDALPALVEAGVVSFKIEGRLKTPEYVAATTTLYRRALDRCLNGEQNLLTTDERRDLSQVYSRGGVTAFLGGTDHQSILEGTFPGHRGIYAGAVTGHDTKTNCLRVELAEELKRGDGLMFTAPSIDPQEKNGPGGRIAGLYNPKGIAVDSLRGPGFLEFERMRLQIHSVPVGARIFRTHDPALSERLKKIITDDSGNHPGVTMHVSGAVNSPLVLVLDDGCGHTVTVESDAMLTQAQNTPLGEGILRDKLGRLGETPYALGEIHIDLGTGLHLPISELNRMRRKAVDALSMLRRAPELKEMTPYGVLAPLLEEPVPAVAPAKPHVVALCRTPEHLEGVIAAGAREVLLDFMELVGLKKALERARAAGLRVGVAPPRITKPGEEKILQALVALAPDEILVRGLGQLDFLHGKTQAVLRGDFSLNAANAITARILIDKGLASVVPSYDLSMTELDLFFRDFPAARCELVVHQHLPMFHTEYCAYAKLLSPGLGFKGTSYADCGRPCEKHRIALKDRTGAVHPVVVDVGCRNTVFSAEANSVADDVPRLLEKGVARLRIELLRETAAEAEQLLRGYHDVLDGKSAGADVRTRSGAVRRLGVLRVES